MASYIRVRVKTNLRIHESFSLWNVNLVLVRVAVQVAVIISTHITSFKQNISVIPDACYNMANIFNYFAPKLSSM